MPPAVGKKLWLNRFANDELQQERQRLQQLQQQQQQQHPEPDQGPVTNPGQGGTSHDDKSSVDIQDGQQTDSQSPQSAQSGLNFSNNLTNAATSSSTNNTSLLQEPIGSSGQDISPALDPSNSPVSRRKSAQMADPKKIQGSGANCSRSLSPSVTEVDDGRPASRRALNRLSTQTSVENVSADEMSSPVTSPDAPPADTHSRTPKPLFNDEEMEDLDDRLEDQSILSRSVIKRRSNGSAKSTSTSTIRKAKEKSSSDVQAIKEIQSEQKSGRRKSNGHVTAVDDEDFDWKSTNRRRGSSGSIKTRRPSLDYQRGSAKAGSKRNRSLGSSKKREDSDDGDEEFEPWQRGKETLATSPGVSSGVSNRGVKTRRSANPGEVGEWDSKSKSFWSCNLCKKEMYYGTQTSRTHMSSEHGLIDEEKLVSSDATLAFNIKQDYHSGECVLCDKTFEGMTNEEVTEHYSFEHQLHDLFYNEPETMLERAKSDEFGPRESRHASIQQTLHSRSDNQEIRDIQPPESIESLLTMVYELRYGEDSYCVNNEACRIVCQKFLNQGKDWLNLSEGHKFDAPQYDHDEPTALKVDEKRVAISNLKDLGDFDVKGGQCDSRHTWIFEMDPTYSLQQVDLVCSLMPMVNWLEDYKKCFAPYDNLCRMELGHHKVTALHLLALPATMVQTWVDRKIYQAEEKSEAKRIKELEAMKDKKRQPEEKQQQEKKTSRRKSSSNSR